MEKQKFYFEKLKKSFFQKPTLEEHVLGASKHIEYLFNKYSDRERSTHLETALDASISVINFQLFKSLFYLSIASASLFFGIKILSLILNYFIEIGFIKIIENGFWQYIVLSIVLVFVGFIALSLFVFRMPYIGDKKELKKRFNFLLSHPNVESLELKEITQILGVKASKFHYESFTIPLKINTKIEHHIAINLNEYLNSIQDLEIFKRCIYLCWEKYSDPKKLNMIMRTGAILFKMNIVRLPDSLTNNIEKREFWEMLLGRTKTGINDSIFSQFFTSSGGSTKKSHTDRYKELIEDFYEIGFIEGVNFINNNILNELNHH